MSLPGLIEIQPLTGLSRDAHVSIPGSKSATNRLLILAALGSGTTRLNGALWSEDTQVMVACLRQLGFEVDCEPDPGEASNRTITVKGLSGQVPLGGTAGKPLELFVGNAGTAARFLCALVCLGSGVYRLQGVPRMHERPQAALFDALRQLGYRIDSSNGKLPALVHGAGPRAGRCQIAIEESSQFASALMLCAKRGQWEIEVTGLNPEESPYVKLTEQLIRAFPEQAGIVDVEVDASSGSYFLAADHVLRGCPDPWGTKKSEVTCGKSEVRSPKSEVAEQKSERGVVRVRRWPESGGQIDAAFLRYVGRVEGEPGTAREISRARDLGDSIMTAIVLAPFWAAPTRFTDLGRLRVQECERVAALRTELTRCGVRVVEQGDTLTVYPSVPHGAQIDTYGDHRMAMCFAVMGLRVPGIQLRDPACVKKTFPNFFQKLAAAPPDGLGVVILEAATRRRLGLDELYAE